MGWVRSKGEKIINPDEIFPITQLNIYNGSECQADSGLCTFFSFGKSMQPVCLGIIFHDQQASGVKDAMYFFFSLFVSE